MGRQTGGIYYNDERFGAFLCKLLCNWDASKAELFCQVWVNRYTVATFYCVNGHINLCCCMKSVGALTRTAQHVSPGNPLTWQWPGKHAIIYLLIIVV